MTLLLVLVFSVFSNAKAQLGADSIYTVGIKETPPFIIDQGEGNYDGLSIRLWESIADDLNINYKYKTYTLGGLLNALENDDIDAAINPLSVTSKRVKAFDFSQPFYITNLAIVTSEAHENTILSFVLNLFSIDFLKAVSLLLFVLLVFGLLVWYFEKRANPEEFENGLKGLWSGIWWSAVTMTTVGYGDKSPKSTGGKIVGLIWMFTAIIIISGFTAGIASSLTLNQLTSKIESPDDLNDFKTGALANSTSAEYLNQNNIAFQRFSSIEQALKAVTAGDLDAVVYDEPILRHILYHKNLNSELEILPFKFNTQYYSFAFPKNSPIADQVNPVLLESIKALEWKNTLKEFGLND